MSAPVHSALEARYASRLAMHFQAADDFFHTGNGPDALEQIAGFALEHRAIEHHASAQFCRGVNGMWMAYCSSNARSDTAEEHGILRCRMVSQRSRGRHDTLRAVREITRCLVEFIRNVVPRGGDFVARDRAAAFAPVWVGKVHNTGPRNETTDRILQMAHKSPPRLSFLVK